MRSPIFLGAEGRRFSQELGLHPQFAVLPLEFAQPGAFGDGQRWFLIGVLLRYLCTQLPRVPSCTCISRATSATGRDDSITIFTASSLNSGVNFLRRSRIDRPPFRAGPYWVRYPESGRLATLTRCSESCVSGRPRSSTTGEPGAGKLARPVRRKAWGNGAGTTPAPRPPP